MSRAFTKEDDAGEDLPERPVPDGPNYVTPRGLEMLKETGRQLVERKRSAVPGEDLRPIERDLRYLEARIGGAIVVPPGSGDDVRFGARVSIEDATGARTTFQIVGADEARADPATLPWSSPLVQAMFGAKAGDVVNWEGGEAAARYKIISVEYPRS